MSETNDKPIETDVLTTHLLDAKKKHDEDKNVESEEVKHLEEGADYLTTMLLQQGVRETNYSKATVILSIINHFFSV